MYFAVLYLFTKFHHAMWVLINQVNEPVGTSTCCINNLGIDLNFLQFIFLLSDVLVHSFQILKMKLIAHILAISWFVYLQSAIFGTFPPPSFHKFSSFSTNENARFQRLHHYFHNSWWPRRLPSLENSLIFTFGNSLHQWNFITFSRQYFRLPSK